MPVYSYVCEACELLTQMPRPMIDRDIPVICLECKQQMKRVIEAAPVHFKGKGFYATDK